MVSVAEPDTVRFTSAVRLFFQDEAFLAMEQEFTFVAFQETVTEPPAGTRWGLALIVTLGESTVTVVCAGADVPEDPEQVI